LTLDEKSTNIYTVFLRLKSFITRKISDSLVNEIRAKHVNELKRLALKYENEKANIEKLNEHRIKHLNREREETIEKLILDNRKEISKLSEKVRLMDLELKNEKIQMDKEREMFYQLEKFYKKKLSEFEFQNINLSRWIKQEFGELIKIHGENSKLVETLLVETLKEEAGELDKKFRALITSEKKSIKK
jgi:hypothetical protein